MRLLALLLLASSLVLAGCADPTATPSDDPAGPDAAGAGAGSLDGGAKGGTPVAQATGTNSNPPTLQAVQDDVSFEGTLGASLCAYNGSGVSCANIGGSNVLRREHDRTGRLTGGTLKVDFSPAAGMGPATRVYIADGCATECHLVEDLAGNGPSLQSPPVGTGGTYDVTIPAATILDNQTLVIRVAPIYLTALASASPFIDVTVTGTLDFEVPA